MEFEDLLYEVKDRIAVITMNRPERLNALTPAMRAGLMHALTTADQDNGVRVIVLTGAGRGFCSGGDVKAMNEVTTEMVGNVWSVKVGATKS